MDTTALTDLWNTRPVRRRHGNSIGGVCAGIARRYRVDATLVKVAFVVAAIFGGSGVILYIAGLVVMPADDEAAPRRRAPRPRPHVTGPHEIAWYWIAAAVVAAVALGNMGSSSPFWGSSAMLGIVLMLAGWWLLYQRTPQAPAGTSADQLRDARSPAAADAAADAPTAPHPAAAGAGGAPGADDPAMPYSGPAVDDDTPPAWDPLGAAPFAWDLPDPSAPDRQPPPKPRRSPVTPVFAGLALIVATAATAAHVAGDVAWFSVGRIAALALAVLGVGMLVDAVQRRPANARAAGLVPLAIVVGAIAVVATLFADGRPTLPAGGVGDRAWHPQSAQQLSERYTLTVGTSVLDLRDLRDLDRDRTVHIRQGIGDVTVLLPADIRVRTRCSTTIGDQTCPDGVVNPDAKTPTLTVEADLSLGSVEMKR
ncbi:PspC domain-containing protein [Gordonia shandongensis]|uniref:PspC domain-containing protein n=1 Tax=Gordonia shandongensis TaxID=376351 RepID=UPI00047DA54C|nr:PspC domain-containing protein [Gordonia shandongensis]